MGLSKTKAVNGVGGTTAVHKRRGWVVLVVVEPVLLRLCVVVA